LALETWKKFNISLRLKWLWQSWDPIERQWRKLLNIHDKTDRAIFFSSTTILIGDGRKTPFWKAKWIYGVSPKDLAPSLYKAARFKRRNVAMEMQNNNWIKNIGEINNSALIDEYVLLHMALLSVTLTQQQDQITWKWTRDGQFLVSSAYNC
jgi:hypothetical protein